MKKTLFSLALAALFVLLFSLPAAAQPQADDSTTCGSEDVCVIPAAAPPAWFLALRAQAPAQAPASSAAPAVAAVSSNKLASVREVVAQAEAMPSYYDSTLRAGAWCKGLENNNIRKYNVVSGQPMLSWEEVIMMVVERPEVKNLGVKPEYLCALLWMESRGNAFDVGDGKSGGADGECGAFQTMPQFYKNYADYCARYGVDYAFVDKTCKRDKWDDYPFHAYPKAELGYNDAESCFHPLNSATAGAIEFGRKLRASSNVREAFRKYNGSGPRAEAYADKAWSRLQKIYDSPAA